MRIRRAPPKATIAPEPKPDHLAGIRSGLASLEGLVVEVLRKMRDVGEKKTETILVPADPVPYEFIITRNVRDLVTKIQAYPIKPRAN